jgi:hypothetical protein
MSEVTAFLAHQSFAVQTALYLAALAFLLGFGGMALILVVDTLDQLGEKLTSNPDWQPPGETSKEETLLLIGVLMYSQVLLTFEPPIRAFASIVGTPLATILILAPIAGALLHGMRSAATR